MQGRERPNGGITRFALMAAILLSCIIISLQRGAGRNGSSFETTTQETIAPLASLLSIPLRGVEGFFTGMKDRSSAYADNQILRDEISILRERQAHFDSLAHKVARYEAILGVDTETDIPLQKIAARAIGETDGPFVRSLLLNVGTRDNVRVGNPVMSTHGLVGHVINAGPNTARVLRISDLNSRIAVASATSDATAILAGDNSPLPKLAFINQRDKWVSGDRVITSGDDGSLPRGLNVGEVVRTQSGDLRVKLSSHKAGLDWLWVSPYEKIIAPTESQSKEGIETDNAVKPVTDADETDTSETGAPEVEVLDNQ